MLLGTRVRSRRRQLGLTLRTVGEISQLSVPYLSQVERNQANPTVTSLASIARALGVSLSFFVPDEESHAVVSRSGEGHDLHIRELPYRVRSLAGRGPDLAIEPLLINIEPQFTSEFTSHLGEEFLRFIGRPERAFPVRPFAKVQIDGAIRAPDTLNVLDLHAAPARTFSRVTGRPLR